MSSTGQTTRQPRRVAWWAVLSLLLLFCVSVTGTACKDEEPVKPPAVKKKLAAPKRAEPAGSTAAGEDAAAPEPAGVVQAPSADPGGPEGSVAAAEVGKKRDPFRSFIELKDAGGASRKVPARPLTPLERYSLDQLRVVGVVAGGASDKALLEDDAGKGYVVGVGDAVGNQGGRIVSIRPDRIVIRETTVDPLGEEKVRNITKRLYAVEKEVSP